MAQRFGPRRSLARAGRIQDDILDRSGLSDVIALLEGQLEEARTLPMADPLLEQAAVESSRNQAAEVVRTRAAGTTGGISRSGAAADAFNLGAVMGSAQLSREGIAARRSTERFQRTNQVLEQLRGASTAGVSASPAAAVIQANAAIRAAKINEAGGISLGAQMGLGALAGIAGILAALEGEEEEEAVDPDEVDLEES